MPEVGHEGNGNEKLGKVTYVRLVVEFGIAVLLAFIGFTLQGMRADTATSLEIGQQNQVAISRMESKLDGINNRLDRLERTQDAQD